MIDWLQRGRIRETERLNADYYFVEQRESDVSLGFSDFCLIFADDIH